MSRRTMFAALLTVLMAAPVMAQDSTNRPGQSGGGSGSSERGGDRGGDRGGFDRGRMTDMIKERMGVTEEEWKVIEPKFNKVSEARREQMGAMFGAYRGRGGDSSGDSQNRSAMQTASRELRDTLENKDATAEQIQAKLTAFREAREKAKATLVSAQKELKEVLTQRQEAVLVSMGMLD
jgi:Spy/CpxP family protein refolding chaperone